jgi:hypothetical protein
MTDRELLEAAARQALEVLESGLLVSHHAQVLINLRAALEQPEQAEPVAWACFKNGELQTELVGTEADVDFWCASDEPEMQGMVKGALYTHPPRRKPLSNEELDRLWREPMSADWEHREYARAIEAALRSKNHD